MRPGSAKYVDEEYFFKRPSSDPINVDFFNRNGISAKMVGPDRIYAQRWYSDPNNKIQQGYSPTMSDADFKKAFIARSNVPTLAEREMAQRAYDKQVGKDVARDVALFNRGGYQSDVMEDWAERDGVGSIYKEKTDRGLPYWFVECDMGDLMSEGYSKYDAAEMVGKKYNIDPCNILADFGL